MIDTSQTLKLARLEAACARDPVAFARTTHFIALAVVSGLVLVFLGALAASLQVLVELATGADTHLLMVVQLLLGGYLVWTGVLAVQPSAQAVQGQPLTPQELPRLFKLLGKVSRIVGVPLPNSVVLSGQTKTEILRSARLGILGGHRHTLVLSLPALMALDVKQFAAVVAHELVRLRGADCRLDAWVHAMRWTWAELAQQQFSPTPEQRLWLAAKHGVVGCFLRYVFPWFSARALVLARYQTHAADNVACSLAGSQAAMDAVLRLEVHRHYLEQAFWPEVLSRANQAPTPNVFPFRAIAKRLRDVKSHPKAFQWLAMSLQKSGLPKDINACVRDRLARLKLSARLTAPPKHTAAEILLRDSLHAIVGQMDAAWQRDVRERWSQLQREHFVQCQLERELQCEAEEGPLHADDHLLWARAARHVRGDDAYQSLLRLMLIDHPNDPRARYELGCLLLEQANADAVEQGADMLRKLAFEQTSSTSLAAAEHYRQWLELQGQSNEGAFWAEEARRLAHLKQEAHQVCVDFNALQRFTEPDLSARLLQRVRKALASHHGLEKAHLVSKWGSEFRGWRFAVLLIESRSPSRRAARKIAALMESLDLPILLAVVDASDPSWQTVPRKAIVAQIRSTPGALVLSFAEQPTTTGPVSSLYMPA